MRLSASARIVHVSLKYGLDEFLLGHEHVRALVRREPASVWREKLDRPRAERLRSRLESLGADLR